MMRNAELAVRASLHYHGRPLSTARPIGELLREWRQRRRLAENFHAAFEFSRAVRVPLWRQRLSRPFCAYRVGLAR